MGCCRSRTFDDFLLGQSAAQNGSPQGLSNVSDEHGGRRHLPQKRALHRLRGLRAGRHQADAAADVECRPALRDLRRADRDRRAAGELRSRTLPRTGPVPAAGTFSGFTRAVELSRARCRRACMKTSYRRTLARRRTETFRRGSDLSWQMTEKPVVVLRGGYRRLLRPALRQPRGADAYAAAVRDAADRFGRAEWRRRPCRVPSFPWCCRNSSYPDLHAAHADLDSIHRRHQSEHARRQDQEYNLNVQYALGQRLCAAGGICGDAFGASSGQVEFDQALLASPQNPVNGETTNSVNNVTARLPIQGVSQGSLFTDSVFIGELQLTAGERHAADAAWVPVPGKLHVVEEPGRGQRRRWDRCLRAAVAHQQSERSAASSYGLAGDDRDQRSW